MTSGWRLMYVIGGAKRIQGKVISLQRFKITVAGSLYKFVLLQIFDEMSGFDLRS